MPANELLVNGIPFYIGDSKMTKLLKFLKRHATPESKAAKDLLKGIE